MSVAGANGSGPAGRARHAVELWGDDNLIVFGGEGGGDGETGTLLADLWALNLTAAFSTGQVSYEYAMYPLTWLVYHPPTNAGVCATSPLGPSCLLLVFFLGVYVEDRAVMMTAVCGTCFACVSPEIVLHVCEHHMAHAAESSFQFESISSRPTSSQNWSQCITVLRAIAAC